MTRKRRFAEAQQQEQGRAQLLGPGSASPNGVEYTSFALQGRQYTIGAPCICQAVAAGIQLLLAIESWLFCNGLVGAVQLENAQLAGEACIRGALLQGQRPASPV